MKKIKFLTALVAFFSNYALAQNDIPIASPPGYTIPQLRSSKDMKIDQSGNVWVAFNLIGLAKYDGTSWTVYDSLNSGLLKNKILSVAANSTGIWAGSDTGLYIFDGISWNRMTVASSGLFSDTVTKLYSPGGIEMYTINRTGFSYYNGSGWVHYNTSNSGLVNDTVQCLYKDASGILWTGTKNGLSRFDGTNWQNFTMANSEIGDNDIRSITEDAGNYLYIGTGGNFINIYDGNNFQPLKNLINSYYNLPYRAGRLFRLQNGDVLFSTINDFLFSGNPISVVCRSGFLASDSICYAEIDGIDRIWKFIKLGSGGQFLWMRDSIGYYPLVTPPVNYYDLDINQVRCGMYNDDMFHWDQIGTAKYEVPKGSGKNSVFSSALWFGGLDPSDNLHMAAQTYRQSGTDFWPGPLDTISATIDSATIAQYNSIWKVSRDTINEFILQYDAGNVTTGSYPVPAVIMSWPAHGSGNYSRNLAPFIDNNGDGIYDPMDGDYPDIKGDQMLWWVMNDNAKQHGETEGVPFGLEIHASAYAHSCQNIPDSNQAVNYTTFYSFDLINRSDTEYHDVYLGLYADFDLGNYLDDYVGCDVEHDFAFAYNGDNIDEGLAGYGANPPMMSVAVLDGPLAEPGDTIDNNHNGIVDEAGEHCMMNHFVYYNNDNNGCSGNPHSAEDYYEYLRSISLCGNHITYGGNGYGGGIGATTIPTDYFFSGTPFDTGWTEIAAGNMPSDRRSLISSGPFNLRKGETRSVTYAYVFTRDETGPNGLNTSIAKNLADVQRVKRWFDTDSFPCNNLITGIHQAEQNFEFSIYPNPARDYVTLRMNSASGKTTLEIFSAIGEKISQYTFPAGRKEFSFKTGNLSKGIYFLRLSGESGSVTKKLVVR
jgi:hypothetical protein